MKVLTKKNALIALAIIAILAIAGLQFLRTSRPLSITEVSCSGSSGIWVKYTLADEATRLRAIPACASSPAGGFVGSARFDAISPTSSYYMTTYTASPESTQKISCGTGQEGKEFAGITLPNDGQGDYRVRVTITYYNQNENYSIPHTLILEDSANIQCLTPNSVCEDGTRINTCSQTYIGQYCTASAYLYERANICGCPAGQRASGRFCEAIPNDLPQPTNQTPIPPRSPVEDNLTVYAPSNQTVPSTPDPRVTVSGIDINQISIAIALIAFTAILIYLKNKGGRKK